MTKPWYEMTQAEKDAFHRQQRDAAVAHMKAHLESVGMVEVRAAFLWYEDETHPEAVVYIDKDGGRHASVATPYPFGEEKIGDDWTIYHSLESDLGMGGDTYGESGSVLAYNVAWPRVKGVSDPVLLAEANERVSMRAHEYDDEPDEDEEEF